MQNPIIAIINPVSGAQNKEMVIQSISSEFAKRSQEVIFLETSKSLNATDIAKLKINEGADLIVSVGGDGTIREIINAIAYKNVTLGIIPNGTGNLLATALGIPIDIPKAVDIICKGHSKTIDLGKINDKYFAIIAGCGFDAEIMKNVTRNDKKLYGLFAYYFEGIRQAFRSKRTLFLLNIDGKKVKYKALSVLVVNSGCILGNLFNVVPEHSLSDGFLDILIVSPKNILDFIPVLFEIALRKNTKNRDNTRIIKYKAKYIQIKTREQVIIQADGDIYGYPPVMISSCTRALKVFVPKNIDTFLMNPDEFLKSLVRNFTSDFEKYKLTITKLDEFK